MTSNLQFPAQLTNLKYLKSTHVWRIELELFESTQMESVNQLTGMLDDLFTVSLVPLDEFDDPSKDPLDEIYHDETVQFALGVSNEEEAKDAINKRITVDLKSLNKDEITEIVHTIKSSIGE